MNRVYLQELVEALLSGDRHKQRRAVDEHVAGALWGARWGCCSLFSLLACCCMMSCAALQRLPLLLDDRGAMAARLMVKRQAPHKQLLLAAALAADNVTFSHILGTVKGRESFYGIYRLASIAWSYKVLLGLRGFAGVVGGRHLQCFALLSRFFPSRQSLKTLSRQCAHCFNSLLPITRPPNHHQNQITWIEYIRSGNTVVLHLDLGIKTPPFYLLRYHFPTIVSDAPLTVQRCTAVLVARWRLCSVYAGGG